MAFILLAPSGSLFSLMKMDHYLSQKSIYQFNPENYVKEVFDLVYRLVYYVVKQSLINSTRTASAVSSVFINQ